LALASETADSINPGQTSEAALNVALLHLDNLIGAGLVRIDTDAVAWPMNEAGARLLEAIGGTSGGPSPAALLEPLAEASRTNLPQIHETLTPAPESRHITVSVVNAGGSGIASLRDNTEERLLQERLLQSEKMASVGQLVSGVAHELNNPLTGVMGFAQLLLSRDLDDTARTQVQTIYAEAERAAKIVQNLLSFARRRRPTKEMADVNGLLQRVLELRSYDLTVRNISLDMTLDARMASAWVDPDQIQQVFFNVIKNAEQSMAEEKQGGRLTVVTRGSTDNVRISIADDGPGIPPDIQRRVFDPFFTTKDAGEGTGLGLTICYSIIDEHGGRIWTENQPGGGAVFHIELPVGAGEEKEPLLADSSSNGVAASGAVTGRRILVVDDEVSIRLLLHDILRLDQHSVALASSGIEAADLVSRETFDVIITDMKMPGMDGAAFYRQVRQQDPGQARRIIFITGDTVSPDTRAFLQKVTNPVLSKPFKIGPLRDAIDAVLVVS
jgi:signal transduction histidine kinase